MNQTIVVGGEDPRRAASVGLGAAPAGSAAAAPVMSADLAFVGEVRTHLTTIVGFSAMLADPKLRLTETTRAEYAAIVETSGVLLAQRLDQETESRRLAS